MEKSLNDLDFNSSFNFVFEAASELFVVDWFYDFIYEIFIKTSNSILEFKRAIGRENKLNVQIYQQHFNSDENRLKMRN